MTASTTPEPTRERIPTDVANAMVKGLGIAIHKMTAERAAQQPAPIRPVVTARRRVA